MQTTNTSTLTMLQAAVRDILVRTRGNPDLVGVEARRELALEGDDLATVVASLGYGTHLREGRPALMTAAEALAEQQRYVAELQRLSAATPPMAPTPSARPPESPEFRAAYEQELARLRSPTPAPASPGTTTTAPNVPAAEPARDVATNAMGDAEDPLHIDHAAIYRRREAARRAGGLVDQAERSKGAPQTRRRGSINATALFARRAMEARRSR